MTPVTIAQLRVTPTVDLMTAARALGLGRTKAYNLARRQQNPCPVLRIGDTHRRPARTPRPRSQPARSNACRPARLTAANLEMLIASMAMP